MRRRRAERQGVNGSRADASASAARRPAENRPVGSTLPELIDRKGLAQIGLTRRSVDHLFDRLPVVSFPNQRKVYLRVSDVRGYLAEHTYNGRDRVRPP